MRSGADQLDLVFAALANPTRRAIMEEITGVEKTVLEIAGHHAMSLNAVSKHLKRLEEAGLIRRDIEGNYHRISLQPEAMKEALKWMTHYVPLWSSSLASLKDHLEKQS